MAHALRQGLGGGLRGLRLAGGAVRSLSGKSLACCGQFFIFHSVAELLIPFNHGGGVHVC